MARQMFVPIQMNGQKVLGMADGSADSDAATWGQVQALVRGLQWKEAVRAATTANVTLSGTQTIDGVALSAGERVLVKNQSTGAENGIYVVAAGAWSRSSDMPAAADARGFAVSVQAGTTNDDRVYVQSADPAIVGTDALTWTQLGGAGATYTADGQGIEESGGTFSLELDGTTLAKGASGLRVGSGAAGAGLTESSGVLAVGAGTGVTVNANDVAVDTSVVARKFSNGGTHSSGTTVVLTHSLGHLDYVVSAKLVSDGTDITSGVDITCTTTAVTLTFASSQSANTIRLTVIG